MHVPDKPSIISRYKTVLTSLRVGYSYNWIRSIILLNRSDIFPFLSITIKHEIRITTIFVPWTFRHLAFDWAPVFSEHIQTRAWLNAIKSTPHSTLVPRKKAVFQIRRQPGKIAKISQYCEIFSKCTNHKGRGRNWAGTEWYENQKVLPLPVWPPTPTVKFWVMVWVHTSSHWF